MGNCDIFYVERKKASRLMGLSGDRLREKNKLFIIMKQVSKERPKLLSLIICKRDCQSFGGDLLKSYLNKDFI